MPAIGVEGKSASGKSTSLMNLPLDKIIYYNVTGKPVPFKGSIPMTLVTSDIDVIIESLKKNTTNCYIIDDSQYLMAFKLIDKVNENGYGKYTEIAKDFKRLIDVANKEVSPDTLVYFLHHTETTDDGFTKMKTMGKMLDNWLTLEGLFSIVIMTHVENGKYEFVTQNDGTSTCKSPIGMFPERMPNDLMKVDSLIREYYGLEPIGLKKKVEKAESKATVTMSDKVPGGK